MHTTDALARFVVQLRADGRSTHTVRQYQRHVGLLARWMAEVGHCGDVTDLDPDTVARFLSSDTARLRADGGEKKPSAMNCLRSSIRSFSRYLLNSGSTFQDPARLVRLALCSPGPPRAMTDVELRRLREALELATGAARDRDRVLIELLLATGLRISSALGLRVEDLDFDDGVAWVSESKGGDALKVHLTRAIAELLRTWLNRRPNGPLFGVSARHAQRRFAGWVEVAGLRPGLTLHSLRHTFASGLYHATGDVLLVQQALHHRAIASTLVYARCDEGRVRSAMGA